MKKFKKIERTVFYKPGSFTAQVHSYQTEEGEEAAHWGNAQMWCCDNKGMDLFIPNFVSNAIYVLKE